MALGWGIIGLGRHANNRMSPAINSARETHLAAVYSRDISIAQDFAQRHNARAAYDSLEAFFKAPGLDVVYVCSPNALHHQHTVQAARAGKHVLCEKPMATTVEHCQEMIEVCAKEGVKLGLAFHARHHPGHQEVRRLVKEGVVGTVALAQAQWAGGQRGRVAPPPRSPREAWREQPDLAGAGAFMDNGVHVVDTLRFILGEEATEVAALADGLTRAQPLEHLVTILLRFQSGTLGMGYSSRRIPDPRRDLLVYGSNGRVAVYDSMSVEMQGTLEVVSETVNKTQGYQRDPVGMYRNMVEAFNHAVKENTEPNASGWDGLQVARITDAFIKSVRTGRKVKLAQPWS